ncbi:MAG: NOL1/NOP2/fmu family ribosome biogenesis protein [Halobacteriales archaeon]|jgi:NOL1/NOP2/fmu family ribosome biogenesis protein
MREDRDGDTDENARENDPQRFERLPATDTERAVPGRPTREAVLEWWHDRFGIERSVLEEYTFWEKGAGKVWAYTGEAADPTKVEALGMTFLRVRQEHWKPTTDAVQRFGRHATQNVIELDDAAARRFTAGVEQNLDWDGDWGYLIAAHEVADRCEPLGVGLFTYGSLQSMIPKGRQRDVPEAPPRDR